VQSVQRFLKPSSSQKTDDFSGYNTEGSFFFMKAKKEGVKTKAENGARREQMPSPLYYSHFAASNTVHNNDERYT
jgi:hypothetical protein